MIRFLKQHPRLVQFFAVTLGLGAIITSYITIVLDSSHREDPPVRVLQRNRERIQQYIESIYAGRIPMRNEDDGYYVLDVLGKNDAVSVHKVSGCIVIRFACFPTDPVPELIYSPNGIGGIPEKYKERGSGLSFFQFRPIDDKWFYCQWDL